ncbi:MAG: hypothetical protein JWO10_671 [Microbacteriaceae bacterium]|nr:hypothetical protein [Microbacteriaceae bacterium]
MNTRSARLARGGLAATVSLFVAACSHAVAGGALPNQAGLLLCFAFSLLACVALAGKKLSTPRLALSVVFSQVLFHGTFTLLGGATAITSPAASAHSHLGTVRLEGLQSTATHGHESMSMTGWMLLAHAFAECLTILALSFGERAFWRMFELAKLALRGSPAMTGIARSLPHRAQVVPSSETLPLRILATVPALRHRGPPAVWA